MKNISKEALKLFKSSYKLTISELENEILQKEIELENFFNDDNMLKRKSSDYITCLWGTYTKNSFKRYYELRQDIKKCYKKLTEYKTTYDLFNLEITNESNNSK